MVWTEDRLSIRLRFDSEQTESLYSTLAEIDAIKTAFRLTDKLLPQTITRLTQSVIVTSAGASNRIEGNKLSDDEVEALYRNLRIHSIPKFLRFTTLISISTSVDVGIFRLDV